MKTYRVRIATSIGSEEKLILSNSSMDAYRQVLLEYPVDAILYAMSVQPSMAFARSVAA